MFGRYESAIISGGNETGLRPEDEHGRSRRTRFAEFRLDEFVERFGPESRYERTPTWNEDNRDGRWRCFDYDDRIKWDKVNFDISVSETRAWKT